MKKILQQKIGVLMLLLLAVSCNRFLEEKSDLRLTTPTTLEDNQALLDRGTDVYGNFTCSGMASSDDFYVTDFDFNGLNYEEDKRLYTWQPDRVSTSKSVGNDWAYCYKAIYLSNAVLSNIDTYKIANADNVRGQALAWRGIRYLDAAQVWCVAYNKATAQQDQGLPLRLDTDMNIPSRRATLQQTYDQILKDLNKAVELLPNKQIAITRPSRIAVLGYLARTYLYMGDYKNALDNAQKLLQLQNGLINYEALSPTDSSPIKDKNIEMLLRTSMGLGDVVYGNIAKVPPSLYNSYMQNDLRKTVFFARSADGDVTFKGNYTGSSVGRLVSVATDEAYLITAESYAQLGDIANAMKALNDLLITRWKVGTYIGFTANNKEEALKIIAQERQKELLFRGTRWADIKRYNRDGAGINLSRIVDGVSYSLPANDLRFAIAIPEEVIVLSTIEQNKR